MDEGVEAIEDPQDVAASKRVVKTIPTQAMIIAILVAGLGYALARVL